MRKLFLIIPIILCLFFSTFSAVLAQDVHVDFFYSKTCPHCADESEFLETLEEKYPDIEVMRRGVWEQENIDLLEELYNKHEVPQKEWGSVPITFIDEYYFLGNNESQNKVIENNIRAGLGLPLYVQIDFFYSKTCPHCADESEFLETLEEKYPDIEVMRRGVWEQENIDLLEELYSKHEIPEEVHDSMSITFINEHYFFGNTENQNKEIENSIRGCLGLPPLETEQNDNKINIPFIGEIDISGFSPLALAVVLGALDGFNACAMVALGFLLTVLVATGIRERVFIIGSVFILVSGIVYFLFISFWLNLLLVLENIEYITIFVGLIVTFFAIFLLKDYFSGVVCKLCQVKPGKQSFFTRMEQKLFLQMQKIISAKMSLPLTILGVAGVAAGINMVELVCSFGFPLIFTEILTSRELPTFSYYSYLLVYVLFYMLDDFIIFMIAVWTLRVTQASEKYLKVIKLISGILLLLLGLIILIKPEILT